MLDEIVTDPQGFVAVHTCDCNNVIAKGAGGVDPLPVMQSDTGYTRIAYPLTPRLRKFIRAHKAVALTVVVKAGPGGLEEISARLQAVELHGEN